MLLTTSSEIGISKRSRNFDQIRLRQLLLLMRGHAALGRFAEAVALHRFRQNHGRLALVLRRRACRR